MHVVIQKKHSPRFSCRSFSLFEISETEIYFINTFELIKFIFFTVSKAEAL